MSELQGLQNLLEEPRNYFRLVKLTMIEGTKAIRKTVLERLPGGQTLHMVLKQREEKLRSLNKGQRSVINKKQLKILYPDEGNLGTLTFLPREGWNADEPSEVIEDLKLPVPIVEYTHTADVTECTECCSQVYNIQYQHMHVQHFDDIGVHYLIDSSGLVYEGRSPKKISSAVFGWNRNITSIALIGNFMYETPKPAALTAFNMLIEYLVLKRYANSSFILYAMCEMRDTSSPGKKLYEIINKNPEDYNNFRHVGHRKEGYCTFNFSRQHHPYENKSEKP